MSVVKIISRLQAEGYAESRLQAHFHVGDYASAPSVNYRNQPSEQCLRRVPAPSGLLFLLVRFLTLVCDSATSRRAAAASGTTPRAHQQANSRVSGRRNCRKISRTTLALVGAEIARSKGRENSIDDGL